MRRSLATAALGLGLALPAPVLAQAVVVPAAMPLPAVEAGPGWQPRTPGVLLIDAFRGGRLDASAENGDAGQPGRFAPRLGNASGGPAY